MKIFLPRSMEIYQIVLSFVSRGLTSCGCMFGTVSLRYVSIPLGYNTSAIHTRCVTVLYNCYSELVTNNREIKTTLEKKNKAITIGV